jgi:hypothetical protein
MALILITSDGVCRIKFERRLRVRCSGNRAFILTFLVILTSGDFFTSKHTGLARPPPALLISTVMLISSSSRHMAAKLSGASFYCV